MIRERRIRAGKGMLSVLAAGAAALCLLWWNPQGRVLYAEDAVVDEENPVDEDAVSVEEASPVSSDPAQVEGLFEVVSENSDSAGENAEDESGSKKDKKKEKEKKLIVGYKQVGAQASIHFEMGEKPSLDRLMQQFPTKLDVYFLGEKKPQTVPVTWESYGDDYSSTNLNYYFFTPKFDSSKYEVMGMNLQSESPYIEVIQNAFTYEMIESAPPKENEAAVVQYCMEKLGLNTAATCGILANIYCESGFRTNAIGDGGTSVGICQWHNSRWTNLRNFVPDDWQTLDGQLRFMRKELLGRYRDTLDYLRAVPDDEQGAYDAAYYWCMHYEMPDRILSRSTTRGYLAKNVYWKRYGLGEDETEAETDEEESEPEMDGKETESETEAEEKALTAESETEMQEEEPDTEAESGSETGQKTEDIVPAQETETETKEEAMTSDGETEAGTGETEEDEKEMKSSFAGSWRCISENGLFIREDRTTESTAVGSIPYDGIVTVHAGDGEWARVSYDGKEGYSKLEFLERIPEEDQSESEL